MTNVNPQMTYIDRVAALPDGGAFVAKYHQVLRVNVSGQVIQHLHRCEGLGIQGLLLLNNNLYVIYWNGTLLEFDINNTKNVQVYQVPDVEWMSHRGSLSYHPSVITHPDLLLLADSRKGEIFSYNVTSKNKQVHLTGLIYPTSVSFMTYNSHLYYIVCEPGRNQVLVYNSTWNFNKTLGNHESGDGQLAWPALAISLPDGSVIIGGNRFSLFTIEGKFVRHLIRRYDGSYQTQSMSTSLPSHLWLTDQRVSHSNLTHLVFHRYTYLYRYKLY